MTPPAAADVLDSRTEVIDGNCRAEVLLSQLNRRLQVLQYRGPDFTALAAALASTAKEHGFDKVFLKAHLEDRQAWIDAGLLPEATIAGYFAGQPAVVMSLFLADERHRRPFAEEQDEILSTIRSRPADSTVPELPSGYVMRRAQAADADDLAGLYAQVFASYPFPITSPAYLIEIMASHVVYRIVRNGSGEIVAAASAETSSDQRSAEMTDFATLPSQRGLGLAQHLLAALEDDMAERLIPNLYTIARARSAGMNRVFYNRGYEWTGTLVNNCHISGRFEDMHVWCKNLKA